MYTSNRMFEPLVLERLKGLFRNDADYEQFVGIIASSFGSATCPVIAEGKIIGVALSPENAKDLIFDRVVEQWSKDPSVLDRLNDALGDDDLVPADDLGDDD